MEVYELEENRPVPLLGLEILSKQGTREWNQNKVCSCQVRDASGECVLSLWNQEVDFFREGDFIVVKKGWCKEYGGNLQVSSGKYGKIELVKRPQKLKPEPQKSTEPQLSLSSYLRPTLSELRSR